MDARITKQRLSNLLSYDWIKIIVTVVVAVLSLFAFFTTLSPRAGRIHTFTVYGYVKLYAGTGAEAFRRDLLSGGAFSYDILKTDVEAFGEEEYSSQAYTARRSAGSGNVMFTIEEDLQEVAGGEMTEMALDVEQYFTDCESYLKRFFGENWQTGEPDAEAARACFLNRNAKDNRFRFSASAREKGVLAERERLEKLREDYLAVTSYFENGTLTIAYVTDEEGKERAQAVMVDSLAGLSRLFYYRKDNAATIENLCMMFFRNDHDAGKPAGEVENDLRYEGIGFLNYLVHKFAI